MTISANIACIVEGHGEVAALPILIRRIAAEVDPAMQVIVRPPIRIGRNKLLKAGELERAIELATRQSAGQGAVLVVLDSDDDCPAALGPMLLHRASTARTDVAVAVVLAHREFEAWFLAAAGSLGGALGLPHGLHYPGDPESIRGAKEWLGQHMGRSYVPTQDQPALAACFDLLLARRTRSFAKFHRDVLCLLGGVAQESG